MGVKVDREWAAGRNSELGGGRLSRMYTSGFVEHGYTKHVMRSTNRLAVEQWWDPAVQHFGVVSFLVGTR